MAQIREGNKYSSPLPTPSQMEALVL